ncbi:hypothetical protein [Alteribacter keqinensis]|uniref:Uncharacterized protein n=1 Tax=Alteribacter keqinensis TaxID=2483800 RepID=A0A3M7TVX5_9BACI|nr:hypothetical protein [Alteribacter keqinensis]RNA69830.1 hypothetical protein EBO34_07815 [Alteribacter keqinensis]
MRSVGIGLNTLLFGLIALFLWVDFFQPDFILSKGMIIATLVVVVIGRVYVLNSLRAGKAENIIFGIMFNLYFMLMLILFNFMGGESQAGFGFDGFLFWIIVVLFVYDTQKRWSKLKYLKKEAKPA